METTVQLMAAKIPLIGFLAVHYWYVIIGSDGQERWEIWQKSSLCESSWGHLHKNLLPAESGVGNGGSWQETAWTGQLAKQLTAIIQKTPEIYPYNYLYRYFPGPNSNTYVQWVLKQANTNYRLGMKGIGKNYRF